MNERHELDRSARNVIAAGREGVAPNEFVAERIRHAVKRTLRGSAPPMRSRSRWVPILTAAGVAALGGALYATELVRRSGEPAPAAAPAAPAPRAAQLSPPASPPKPTSDAVVPPAPAPTSAKIPTGERADSPRPSRSQKLAAEIEHLARVNAAVNAGDGARALALLAEYDREFRPGMLGEERAAASVLALCAAGRTADARGAAKRFATKWPRSPLSDRVAGSCAGKQ